VIRRWFRRQTINDEVLMALADALHLASAALSRLVVEIDSEPRVENVHTAAVDGPRSDLDPNRRCSVRLFFKCNGALLRLGCATLCRLW
jgi:hypothetical protein